MGLWVQRELAHRRVLKTRTFEGSSPSSPTNKEGVRKVTVRICLPLPLAPMKEDFRMKERVYVFFYKCKRTGQLIVDYGIGADSLKLYILPGISHNTKDFQYDKEMKEWYLSESISRSL